MSDSPRPALVPRTVALAAVALLVALSAGGAARFGLDWGLGTLLGGAVMLASWLLGGWVAVRAPSGPRAAAFAMAKLPLVGLALWALFSRFPVVAVVAGGAVVMLAALGCAARDASRPVQDPQEAA